MRKSEHDGPKKAAPGKAAHKAAPRKASPRKSAARAADVDVVADMDADMDADAGGEGDPHLARAEAMVDVLGEQVGEWTAQASQTLRRLLARAREEAEDIWAEAKDLHEHR